jgi:hypothetical protein
MLLVVLQRMATLLEQMKWEIGTEIDYHLSDGSEVKK